MKFMSHEGRCDEGRGTLYNVYLSRDDDNLQKLRNVAASLGESNLLETEGGSTQRDGILGGHWSFLTLVVHKSQLDSTLKILTSFGFQEN